MKRQIFTNALTACLLALTMRGVVGQIAPDTSAPATPTAPLPGYKLVWSDEFNTPTLDTTQWEYRTDSKLWSTQAPANVSVRDGLLHLALKKEAAGGKAYTGGGIISKRTFRYGYYEARFKVPPSAGWHTSFWTMQHDGSGGTNPRAAKQEIDICEQDSVNTKKYSAGVISWSHGNGVGFGRKYRTIPVDLSADFHTYGCEFTPTVVRFYLDGVLTHETDATKFPHADQNIWLTSIAAGYGGTRAVDDSRLPTEAVYDWVRYWQKE